VTAWVRHRSMVRSAAVELLGCADADGRLTEDTGQIFGGQSEANGGRVASAHPPWGAGKVAVPARDHDVGAGRNAPIDTLLTCENFRERIQER
jgi:hypothetical protein